MFVLGALRVAVTVTIQVPISALFCELIEKVFALGVAAGLVIVSQVLDAGLFNVSVTLKV